MQPERHSPEPGFATCRGRTRVSQAGSANKPARLSLLGINGSVPRWAPAFQGCVTHPSPGRWHPAKLCSRNPKASVRDPLGHRGDPARGGDEGRREKTPANTQRGKAGGEPGECPRTRGRKVEAQGSLLKGSQVRPGKPRTQAPPPALPPTRGAPPRPLPSPVPALPGTAPRPKRLRPPSPAAPSPETTSASLGPTVWQLPMAPEGRRALGGPPRPGQQQRARTAGRAQPIPPPPAAARRRPSAAAASPEVWRRRAGPACGGRRPEPGCQHARF